MLKKFTALMITIFLLLSVLSCLSFTVSADPPLIRLGDDFPDDDDDDDDDDDTDGDGIPDDEDDDDDGDGIPDDQEDDDDPDDDPDDDDDDDPYDPYDIDGDGEPNWEDDDMDGDGIPNNQDTDMDGDGVPNDIDGDNDNDGYPDQDFDGDGIPDAYDDDIDGDGIPNDEDPDDDDDGIPDDQENDLDGDGIPDDLDYDMDNDGLPDWVDPDIDGDDIPNSEDDDMDGDGIPNEYDEDIDGDGIPNDDDDDPYHHDRTEENGTCFLAGTKILMADGRLKNIEKIKPGDKVLSVNINTGKVESDRVKRLVTHSPAEMNSGYVEIRLDTRNRIKVTPNHLCMVSKRDFREDLRSQPRDSGIFNDRYKFASLKAGSVRVGDKLVGRTVISIESYPDAEESSYDIQLENNINYIVVGTGFGNDYIEVDDLFAMPMASSSGPGISMITKAASTTTTSTSLSQIVRATSISVETSEIAETTTQVSEETQTNNLIDPINSGSMMGMMQILKYTRGSTFLGR